MALQIRCTRKLLDELDLSEAMVAEIRPADTLLGNWYANVLRIEREKCVLVMNEKTLYSFILPWSFKSEPGKFRQAFIDGLRQALEAEWVDPADIARVLKEYEQVEFTSTESKRLLGNMNDLAKQYEYRLPEAGGVKSRHLTEIVRDANQTPQRNLEWLHSKEALERLFRDKNRKGDEPPRREPDDHEVITRSLRKIGADHTLHEIYGLFYGCAAAPTMVMPSRFIPLMFDPKDAVFDSEQEARALLDKLMTLWNKIAGWDPHGKDFLFPPTKYPMTVHGLLTRSEDLVAFVHYFIKGLDVGGMHEGNFSSEVTAALRDLADLTGGVGLYIEQLEKAHNVSEKVLQEGMEQINGLEPIAADCIGRVHKGLRSARLNASPPPVPAQSSKVGRNEPCPCGSGRKFKRCCGLTH